jgi:hypothetical protein
VLLHAATEIQRVGNLLKPLFKDPVTEKIARFLIEIGIDVGCGELPEKAFLPGVTVVRGALVVDEPRLLSGGDLLHEAGHLALMLQRSAGT